MNIIWHGYSCFRIQEQTRDREVTLVTDPFAPEGSDKLPRNLTADLVTVSHDHPRHNHLEAVGGEPFVINTPGEFEVKEMFVTGVSTFHDKVEGKEKGTNVIYFINVGGIHLLHLGDLRHPLEEKHLKDLHGIDVLFLPVGGGDVLDPKQAKDLVAQVEPRIIVPMHYRVGALCPQCEPVDGFLKAMGLTKPEPVAKLKLSEKDLPQDEMKVVILEPQ